MSPKAVSTPARAEVTRASFPLGLKIGLSSFGIVTATVAIVLTLEYRDQRRAIQETTGQTLQAIAATAALFVNGDAHRAIREEADVDGVDYERVKQVLLRVQSENHLEDQDLLTLWRGPKGFEYIVGLQDPHRLYATPYVPPPEVRPALLRAIDEGTPSATLLYSDNFGSFVSAFAPIRAASGQVVAVLEVDNDVSLLLKRLQAHLLEQTGIGAVALALALLLSFVVARSTTRSVTQLIRAIDEVQAGNYDARAEVASRDEMGVLASVFNAMLRSLRERLAMLRFVPRHTRALIAQAVADHQPGADAFGARKRELAILFSDIRGFTALSDSLPPNRVIEMLNVYLRKESEIVERHGGSIDKFIGDAVMAIFEGPDRFADAVKSALDIQAAMAALNAAKAFESPIEVGIGIAGGEVVMGSVGSEDRMELAVIGRLVNLASRLTSTASRGEVVVSDLAFDRLGGRFEAEQRAPQKLKGFAEAQVSYVIRGPTPA